MIAGVRIEFGRIPVPHKILRIPQVIAKTGLARSTIYQYMSTGNFPRQVKLGPRTAGWLEEEIDAWIARRIAVSRDS